MVTDRARTEAATLCLAPSGGVGAAAALAAADAAPGGLNDGGEPEDGPSPSCYSQARRTPCMKLSAEDAPGVVRAVAVAEESGGALVTEHLVFLQVTGMGAAMEVLSTRLLLLFVFPLSLVLDVFRHMVRVPERARRFRFSVWWWYTARGSLGMTTAGSGFNVIPARSYAVQSVSGARQTSAGRSGSGADVQRLPARGSVVRVNSASVVGFLLFLSLVLCVSPSPPLVSSLPGMVCSGSAVVAESTGTAF